MRVNRTGHADAAEQQRDETHEAQEMIHIVEDPAHLTFAVVHVVGVEVEFLELGLVVGDQLRRTD